MSQGKLFIASVIGGIVITIALTAFALSPDFKGISKVLLWQDTILVYVVGPGPLLYTDAQGKPHYEGTPIHMLILPVGFLLGVPFTLCRAIFSCGGLFAVGAPRRSVLLNWTRPNKSLDRSASQRAFHRQLAPIEVACAPGQFHRYPASLFENLQMRNVAS